MTEVLNRMTSGVTEQVEEPVAGNEWGETEGGWLEEDQTVV